MYKKICKKICGKLVRVRYHTHTHTHTQQTESKLNQMAFIYKQLYLFIVSRFMHNLLSLISWQKS